MAGTIVRADASTTPVPLRESEVRRPRGGRRVVVALLCVALVGVGFGLGRVSAPARGTGSSLAVLSATGGTFTTYGRHGVLTLTGVGASIALFADRPARSESTEEVSRFLRDWRTVFGGDPPNAALALRGVEVPSVVTIASPRYDRSAGTVRFDATVVPGSTPPPAAFGALALFVDDFPGMTDRTIQNLKSVDAFSAYVVSWLPLNAKAVCEPGPNGSKHRMLLVQGTSVKIPCAVVPRKPSMVTQPMLYPEPGVPDPGSVVYGTSDSGGVVALPLRALAVPASDGAATVDATLTPTGWASYLLGGASPAHRPVAFATSASDELLFGLYDGGTSGGILTVADLAPKWANASEPAVNGRLTYAPPAPPTSVTVPGSPKAMALSPDGQRLYIAVSSATAGPELSTSSSASAADVVVVDVASRAVIDTIPVPAVVPDSTGQAPAGGIAVSPDGQKIYVAMTTSGTVAVISAISNEVVALVPVGVAAGSVAVSADSTQVFVATTGIQEGLVVLDAARDVVTGHLALGASTPGTARTPVVPAFGYHSLALGVDGTLYVMAREMSGGSGVGLLVAVDPVAGKQLAQVALPNPAPAQPVPGFGDVVASGDPSKVFVTGAGAPLMINVDGSGSSLTFAAPIVQLPGENNSVGASVGPGPLAAP